jgi:aminoglycoside phosphotransferase (APT) family kinase protein
MATEPATGRPGPLSGPTGASAGESAERPSDHITTTTRDPAALGAGIEIWLRDVLPAEAAPVVTDVVRPEGNGMSSETVLLTARWTADGRTVDHRCVGRIEPELGNVPVFPTYDLDHQFRGIALVGDATDVPLPEPLWFEPDARVIGAPFFLMRRVDGLVPPDVLPYTFGDNWTFDATNEQRARMQRSAVDALTGIHAITPEEHDLGFLAHATPGATSLERHLAHWERYLDWVVGDERSSLLDACFAWLRDHLPVEGVDTGVARLSWGDARVGNMLFADFEAVGVLDWEMAGVAPPEVDLGWMAYLHRFFQDLATDMGAPGLPGFLRPVDLAARYAELTGRTPGDLRWPMAYAAMRHGVIMRRVTERSIAFGEAVRPDDIDDLIIHRRTLREMLDGTYWDRVALDLAAEPPSPWSKRWILPP